MLNNIQRSEQDLSGFYILCVIGCRLESVISEVEHGECSLCSVVVNVMDG